MTVMKKISALLVLVLSAPFSLAAEIKGTVLWYMEQERPERVAVWGFVTHITEYSVGSKGENPPDPEALAALDRFLAHVDSKRAEGRVVYVTAGEAADLAFVNQ